MEKSLYGRSGGNSRVLTFMTGLGPVGYSLEAPRDPKVYAVIFCDTLEVLKEPRATVKAGVLSSPWPQNPRMRLRYGELKEAAKHSRCPLQFDLQTVSGILARVPEGTVRACIEGVRDYGYLDDRGASIVSRKLLHVEVWSRP